MKTITIGNNTGNTYTGTADTTIGSEYFGFDVTTFNSGGTIIIFIANMSTFDLSGLINFHGLDLIPGSVKVLDAKLRVHGTAYGNVIISCRRVLRDWIEGSQDGLDRNLDTPPSACFLEYGNNQPWTVPGCLGEGTDRISDIMGSITIGTTKQWYELSGPGFSNFIEGIINGTIENNGLHMTIDLLSDSALAILKSSENDDGFRPYLEIVLEPIPSKSIIGNINDQYIKGEAQPSYIKGEVN